MVLFLIFFNFFVTKLPHKLATAISQFISTCSTHEKQTRTQLSKDKGAHWVGYLAWNYLNSRELPGRNYYL